MSEQPTSRRPDPWWEDAACAALPPQMFDTDLLSDAGIRAARYICGTCPVTHECLTHAMRHEGNDPDHSRGAIYGGLTPRERATLAQQRKTA